MRPPRLHTLSGLSLVEVLVSMAMFATVMTLGVTLLLHGLQMQKQSALRLDLHQASLLATQAFTRDVRQALHIAIAEDGHALHLTLSPDEHLTYRFDESAHKVFVEKDRRAEDASSQGQEESSTPRRVSLLPEGVEVAEATFQREGALVTAHLTFTKPSTYMTEKARSFRFVITAQNRRQADASFQLAVFSFQ